MMNNADTGVIVSTDQQLSPEQQAQVLASLRSETDGGDGGQAVAPGRRGEDRETAGVVSRHAVSGKQEAEPPGDRRDLWVPATLMGFTEDANRAIAQEERLSFIENGVAKYCDLLEAAMTQWSNPSAPI